MGISIVPAKVHTGRKTCMVCDVRMRRETCGGGVRGTTVIARPKDLGVAHLGFFFFAENVYVVDLLG
ncbi:hypothetical protein ES332_D01G078000v1 [Gossypium tomentosum]|uniref:Uncharacterized protein n=1 Tax=Gossypium tomentosum TaxID=34277 RepID=A0A5D2M6D9_GOSTO|nr:hypothetical protein ES332_D01G078000v1 [Gossypium tomentosum]